MNTQAWRLVLVMLLAFGCESRMVAPADVTVDELRVEEIALPAGPLMEAPSEFQEARRRLVIRTAEMRLEVADVDTATARIRGIAERVEGLIEGLEQVTVQRQARWSHVSFRVPEPRLDEAVQAVAELGEVERTSVSAREVTEEVEDLDARLRNLRQLEDRLLRLLDQRTGSLEDVLAAERELARVREEIERREGRLRRLEHEAAWSMMRVEMHEPLPIAARASGGLGTRLLAAFAVAWQNFVELMLWVIAALGFIVPLVLFALAVYWAYRRFGPKGAGKTSASAKAAGE